jgi:hypothetical protein
MSIGVPDEHSRQPLGAALRWFGLALVSAPFVLALVWITSERILGWMPGELPIGAFGVVPILVAGIGAFPFFLVVPWLIDRVRWFDRGLPGALMLSLLLSIPAALSPVLLWKGLASVTTVWIIALGSIAVPRLIAKSLRPGAFSPTRSHG